MSIQEAVEQLNQLQKEIREVDNTHSLRFRGGKAIEIIERVKPKEMQDNEELERQKETAAENINLSLDRETGWAESSYSDSRKKKSKISGQRASNDLQHAISHVINDIDEFIDIITKLS